MTKIGDKEAQRRALRERRVAQPQKPLPARAVDSVDRPEQPDGHRRPVDGVDATGMDEVTRALAYYRKHRERQARWRKRKKEGK